LQSLPALATHLAQLQQKRAQQQQRTWRCKSMGTSQNSSLSPSNTAAQPKPPRKKNPQDQQCTWRPILNPKNPRTKVLKHRPVYEQHQPKPRQATPRQKAKESFWCTWRCTPMGRSQNSSLSVESCLRKVAGTGCSRSSTASGMARRSEMPTNGKLSCANRRRGAREGGVGGTFD
jgi:hypothetical protein